jgi:endonuclease/exonuclease/phosphatase family metal-dependent hydrolase
VGEWNVHWGVKRVPHGPRPAAFDVVAAMGDVLAKADVLVMPESFRYDDGTSFLDDVRALGFEHLVESRFVRLDLRPRRRVVTDEGQGWWVLAIASRRPIVASRELPLVQTIGDAVPQRHAVALTLDVDGREVDVVGFHVSSKLWWLAPWVHLWSLRSQLARAGIDGSARPALVLGDANLWRSWMPTVLPGWRPLVRGATFPSWRPHSQIDQILARGAVEPVEAGVVPYTATSDHRAVFARVALA